MTLFDQRPTFWPLDKNPCLTSSKAQQIGLDALVAGQRPSIYVRRIVAWSLNHGHTSRGLGAALETTLPNPSLGDGWRSFHRATRWRSTGSNLPQPTMQKPCGVMANTGRKCQIFRSLLWSSMVVVGVALCRTLDCRCTTEDRTVTLSAQRLG